MTLPDRKRVRTTAQYERAERQRWRALLLVLKAKLESVESNIETFENAFLAQIVMPGDQTVADLVGPHIIDAAVLGVGTLPVGNRHASAPEARPD